MYENRLSPFYNELLEYLQRDVEQRCSDEGLDPRSNQEVQTFLQGLVPVSPDQSFPLDQIIHNYHHLFGSKGPIPLEKSLLAAFPAKDFIELGLTRCYPRVYRGLPRLYYKDFPSTSLIEKGFTHLPSLKKAIASKSLFTLYGKLPARGKVTLFTWVMADGLGDYMAAVEVMRLLKGRFAELDVKLIGLIDEESASRITFPPEALIVPYKKECSFDLISDELFLVLRESDLILQLPTFYPRFEQLIEKLKGMKSGNPMPQIEHVGQYGYIQSTWFHPQSGNYSMGLHFLERGILVRKPCLGNWADIQNEQILKWRKEENLFYLAYLSTPIGGAVYLHSLLKSLENETRDIDLCVPDLKWFIDFVQRQNEAQRPILEGDLGVESIDVYYKDQIHSTRIGKKGKKIRILSPGVISQSDFRVLLALSGDWVAVRGDQSFSEAVSQGKSFFYDGREHLHYFVKDLIALAANRIGAEQGTMTCIRGMGQAFLHNAPPQEGDWVDESFFQEIGDWQSIALSMGVALQDPSTHEGFGKLNRIFVEECSANGFFCQLVQRALCQRENPKLARFEAASLALFIAKGQTFRQMIESQRAHIAQIGERNGSVSKNGK